MTGSGLPSNVNTLSIGNASGVTLSNNVAVTSGLMFTNGILTTGSYTIQITFQGALNGVGSGKYINGNLARVLPSSGSPTVSFDVGDASRYTPISLTFNNITAAGTITAKTTGSEHPSISGSGIDQTKDVNRYWTLTNTTAAFTNYSAIFNFINPGDIDAGANTSNFVIKKFNSPTWASTTAGTRTTTSTQATGLTSFSDFAIGEPASVPTYTITASSGANGTVTPAGVTTVPSGGSQSYAITPTTGYHVADVLVDGSSVGAVTSYNFTNVVANHTISASFAINTFTITASSGANGSVTPAGVTTVNYNGSQSYAITPTTGYHVANVLVDGSSVGAVTSYNFTNVVANHTISATFAINTFTITASSGANGSVTPAGVTTVNYNGSQSYAITPSTGYHVADVLVDGSSVGAVTSYNFTSVVANHTISASFAINTFTITASSGANGSVTPAGVTTVNYNGSQSYAITPTTGYHVADVLVDGSSVGAVTSYNFTSVVANHTISATFAINTFTITASSGANGSVTPAGVTTVNYNGSQSYAITPATGYHVADVLVDGSSVGAVTSYNFTSVIANHTISASFAINTYTITASAGANGSVTPAGVTTVNYNGSQSYAITPAMGYHVADVLVDGSSVGAVTSYNFTNVTANHTINASFAINTYTITATAGAGGSIAPAGVTTVNYGGNQCYTIIPDAGYHVADVLVDGLSVGAVTSYDFTNVTANHTISASFAIDTYTITASAGTGGSIAPPESPMSIWRQSRLHYHT